MYRNIEDFIEDWNASSNGTLKVIKAITNEKIGQSIVDGHNSLGWLAWHLVGVTGFFGGLVGLNIPAPGHGESVPTNIADIVARYEQVSQAVSEQASKLSDAELIEEIQSFAGATTRGKLLRSFIDHQNHHRGQMTVLLRQAGLTVPAVMGPTKEMAKV
ncbi:DinB family protein [Paenibacillus endoradicis]|uniref:DinB family protein n=1 Tax=Paenibacillus endoradicis TaxID=2972487 RepID=UPI002158E559|nr:DinB family protein [Paenibacillus endoradicis]MCR8659684.1 DinB family protein [Paenibacillus endoradicis]